MYEKLDKLRAEVKRWEQKIEDDKAKLRQAQDKLKEAEHSQILSDVGALKLSPEEVAKLLQLAASGQLSVPTAENKTEPTTTEATSSIYGDDDSDDNKEESEDEDY